MLSLYKSLKFFQRLSIAAKVVLTLQEYIIKISIIFMEFELIFSYFYLHSFHQKQREKFILQLFFPIDFAHSNFECKK